MADGTQDGQEDQGGSGPPSYPPSQGSQPGPHPAYPPSTPPPAQGPGGGLPSYPGGGSGQPSYPPPSGGYGPSGGNYPPPGGGYGQGGAGYPPPGAGWGQQPYPGEPTYGYGAGPTVPPEVYASYWPRVGGWLIEALIVWVVSYLVSLPLRASHIARFTVQTHTGSVTRSGHFSALEFVAEVVIVLVYGAIFCGSTRGQTPGMMAVGVRAVDRDTGGRIGFARALWRGVFEYVLFILLFVPWILDMLFPLWDSRRQTLHDKASRTVVVRAALYPPAPPR
jgi:uncharacterized RDD family membrane protein YckC